MTADNAIKILDPDAEQVWRGTELDDLDTVKEACRTAVKALRRYKVKKLSRISTEFCKNCNDYVDLVWNAEKDGYIAHCPKCGSKIRMCDDCFGACDFDGEKCFREEMQNEN